MVPVEILRPVTTGGVTHERGEIVDAQNWPKLNSMLRAGKVRPYLSPEVLAHVAGGEKAAKPGKPGKPAKAPAPAKKIQEAAHGVI